MLFEILKYGTKAFVIDEYGLDHEIELDRAYYYIAENKKTVKVEGLESYYTEYYPKTVHLYISPKDAVSFPSHIDPYNVTLKVLDGIKTIILDGVEHEISDTLFIPANVPHQATNKYNSVMLSIGDE